MSGETTEADEGAPQADEAASGRRNPDLAVLIAGAVVLVLCVGAVLYGVLGGKDDTRPEHKVATAPVTYEVTGDGIADISYQGVSEKGEAETASGARLPWRRTVQVPVGRQAVVRITLGEKGGQATCSLAVHGKHVQSATAGGAFGRATCSGPLTGAGAAGRG